MLTQAIPVVANVLRLAGISVVQGGHDWLYEASEVLLTLLLLRTLEAIGWVEAVAFALLVFLLIQYHPLAQMMNVIWKNLVTRLFFSPPFRQFEQMNLPES